MGDSVPSQAIDPEDLHSQTQAALLAPVAFTGSAVDVPSAGPFHNPNPAGAHVIPFRDITIDNEIARGAFGIVSVGRWRGIPIAFKQLYGDRLSSRAIENFKVEIQRNAQIINDNVVRIYGYTIDGGIYGIVMQPMIASVRAHFVDASGGASRVIPFHTKLGVLVDVASGLSDLHKAGIVHLDLKSQNVLLNELGHAKIADFGLSLKSDSDTSGESLIAGAPLGERRNCGTPTHMAPELFVFHMPHPPSSVDVYAFGIFTWEVLTQRDIVPSLLQGPRLNDFVVRGGRPRTEGQCPPDVPPAVIELMAACWTANPKLRPPMAAVLDTLRGVRAG